MARIKKDKSTRVNPDWKKTIEINAPISTEDLIIKEVALSRENSEIRELSVLTDPANEDSTRIKLKIHILDHPKNLIEFLCARLAINNSLSGNNITKVLN